MKDVLDRTASKYYEIGIGSYVSGKFKKKIEIEEGDLGAVMVELNQEKLKTLKRIKEKISRWGLDAISESLFSNVCQRTDQIDVLYFGDQLPEHCQGHHPGYPLAQTLAGMKLTN